MGIRKNIGGIRQSLQLDFLRTLFGGIQVHIRRFLRRLKNTVQIQGGLCDGAEVGEAKILLLQLLLSGVQLLLKGIGTLRLKDQQLKDLVTIQFFEFFFRQGRYLSKRNGCLLFGGKQTVK